MLGFSRSNRQIGEMGEKKVDVFLIFFKLDVDWREARGKKTRFLSLPPARRTSARRAGSACQASFEEASKASTCSKGASRPRGRAENYVSLEREEKRG